MTDEKENRETLTLNPEPAPEKKQTPPKDEKKDKPKPAKPKAKPAARKTKKRENKRALFKSFLPRD